MKRIPANSGGESELLYPELSYDVVGLCYDVHNEIGPYAKEKQYGDRLEQKLKEKGIPYQRELRIGNTNNIIDFLADGKIALELKAKAFLLKGDYTQMQRYLQASGVKLGILVNFKGKFVRSHRVVRISYPGRKPGGTHL